MYFLSFILVNICCACCPLWVDLWRCGPSLHATSAVSSLEPSVIPSLTPSLEQSSTTPPSQVPSLEPSAMPSLEPSVVPSLEPSGILPSLSQVPSFDSFSSSIFGTRCSSVFGTKRHSFIDSFSSGSVFGVKRRTFTYNISRAKCRAFFSSIVGTKCRALTYSIVGAWRWMYNDVYSNDEKVVMFPFLLLLLVRIIWREIFFK